MSINTFYSNQSIFSKHSFIYENIPKTISLFYFLVTVLSSWLYRPSLSLEQYNSLSPPPLLFFIRLLSPEILIFFVNITPLIFLVTALFPRFQFLRILSALFCIFSYGFDCSLGISKAWVLIVVYGAVSLAFMPSLPKKDSIVTRMDKHIRIFYFWIFHGAILVPYFVSGLTKLFYGGIYQLIFDDVSIWSPYAMAYTVESYSWMYGSNSWIGDLVVNHIWLSAPMYILATILEILSLLPLFFPRLWKLIILQLAVFHLFINWTLNISFSEHMFILLVVFYNTPFSYPLNSLKGYYTSMKQYFMQLIKE